MSKFKFPSIPTATVKSVRFPDSMLEEIEEIINTKDCSFSAFVVECVRFALEDIKENKR